MAEIDRKSVWRRCIEVVFSLILLAAAILKAHQLFSDTAPVVPGVIHYKAILVSVIQAEILLAAWLFFGGAPRARFICATAAFTGFAAISAYEVLHALPSCGCFGNVKVPPLITCAFDLSAILALYYTRPPFKVAPPPFNVECCVLSVERCIKSPSKRRIITAISIVAVASVALWTAYFLHLSPASSLPPDSPGSLVILEPKTWLNKPFPLFDEIQGGEKLRTGKWLVLLYHHDCDTCLQAIPEYLKLTNEPNHPQIAFIAMPPTDGQDPVPDSPNYLHSALRLTHDWFATTPVLAILDNGQVQTTAEGEKVLTHHNFSKNMINLSK